MCRVRKAAWIIPLLMVFMIFLFLGIMPVMAAGANVMTIEIPDYLVTDRDGLDDVDIPGGEVLAVEEGRPRVPYWVQTWNYPAGERVQYVQMQERSGLITAEGMKLSAVRIRYDPEAPAGLKSGWYPQEIFSWQVIDNADGSTTLSVSLFPFYYNPDTLEAAFYRRYSLLIEKTETPVRIHRIATDKELYPVYSAVNMTLFLQNASQPRDVVAQVEILNTGTGESVGSLPLQSLPSLHGDVSCSFTWNSGGLPAGDYRANFLVTDTSGNVQDRAADDILIREAKEIKAAGAVTAPGEEKSDTWIIVLIAAGIIIVIAVLALPVVWYRKKKGMQEPAGSHSGGKVE